MMKKDIYNFTHLKKNNEFESMCLSFNDGLTEEEQHKINNIIEGKELYYNWKYNFDGLPITKKYLLKSNNYLNIEYEILKIKNKDYYKFEDDPQFYPYKNGLSYIGLKKQLIKPFQLLIYLLENHIEDDIKEYLNIKFFNNISKADYYNFNSWFTYLFYYYFQSIRNPDLYFKVINYKNFRKWALKNAPQNSNNKIAIINILKEFNNICPFTYAYYGVLKSLFNFFLNFIDDGGGHHLK
jgi:hypothetical protein